MQHCFPVLLVCFKPEYINNNSASKCDHILFGDVFFANLSVFARRGWQTENGLHAIYK